MTNNSPASIECLPVELFHRIFDHLDAQTILFSVRAVCHLFLSIVNSYDRYKFDFEIISKSNFHRLCRLIPPQHLISLTLYHNDSVPNQIPFFISKYRLRQLTRLRSLNLFGINEVHLDLILKRINLNSLTSFSLHIQKYDDRRRKTTKHYLSLIMTQPTLRKVELKIQRDRISKSQWSLNCRIEFLTINREIIIADLIRIISCTPQLRQLILKKRLLYTIYTIIPKLSFAQITSLTLEEFDMTIEQLESFLSLTPSLIYLKLIGECSMWDGKRWEEFIQVNLPQLDKFEFFINSLKPTDQTQDDLRLIIESFQSPFWIECKKWFVTCEFCLDQSRVLRIYSMPMCKAIYDSQLYSEKCVLSTSNDLFIGKNVNEMILHLKMLINNDIFKRINTSFPNVTKLSIDIPRKISANIINYLPEIINISQLIQVKLESYYFGKDNKDALFNIINLLQGSSKLSSLIIHSRYYTFTLYPFLNDLCSILPRQINYLQIPIIELKQIEIILEQCPYLALVKFEVERTECSPEVVYWFRENTIDSLFARHNGCDCIWIGKKIDPSSKNSKRMKLMDNESNLNSQDTFFEL